MTAQFEFSRRQKAEIIKELGTDRGISHLEGFIQEYRQKCRNKITPAEIRSQLRDTLKLARRLRRQIASLSRVTKSHAEWVVDPLLAYESYTDALLAYRFPGPLKRGRLRGIPTTQLIQATATLWEEVRGKRPGRGRGPFTRLIGKMLRYSGVPGARTSYIEELVVDALPVRLSLPVAGPKYPFTPLEEFDDLSPLNRAAESYFMRVDMVIRGEPTLTLFASPDGGENP